MRDLLKLAGVILLPMALIAKEPDLGTALTYLPILAVGVFLAGMPWRYWMAIAVVALVVAPIGIASLQGYQKARLVSFLDPERDPQGTGYQLIQSKIAVGAGGTWGKGVTKGSQTQLRFLPVPHTDFIFSAFAEEHGFRWGGLRPRVVLHFAVQGGAGCPDLCPGSRVLYICMGVGALLLFHKLVNGWNGGGANARHRDSASADELWRVQHLVHVSDAGLGEQCSGTAVCELN